ncbi:hypothetical protein PsorP6_007015 [Peronosclerospora sorghi]|uniref:Uncharacterized protein n=1 Tax=Peronosclerospora sorghi TaxID=230839 RepID=A0ACC0WDB4_9STRA|nr:hypothetical protein PsorP6_007015 [Peronosclerospora sorghi]
MMAIPVAVSVTAYEIRTSPCPVSGDMTGRIVTPLKDGDLRRAVARGGDVYEIEANNMAIKSIRQAEERGMGSHRKCFR